MRSIGFILALILALPAHAQEGGGVGLPTYPSASSVPLDSSMRANDVPLDAVVVMTSDPVKRVLGYYRAALAQRGIEPVEHMFSPQSGYVGFFDETSGRMRMATVTTRPGGGSMLVLSSMDPRPLVNRSAEIPADLPSLPDAMNIATTQSPIGSAGQQRTVSFTVSGAKPKQARARLIESATALGWNLAAPEKPFGLQDLVLKRGREMCVIRVFQNQEENTRSTSIVIIAVDRDQGDWQ